MKIDKNKYKKFIILKFIYNVALNIFNDELK